MHGTKKTGDEHVSEEGRVAEIVDTVFQARVSRADNMVNGPEGSVVSAVIKQLRWKFYLVARCFQER